MYAQKKISKKIFHSMCTGEWKEMGYDMRMNVLRYVNSFKYSFIHSPDGIDGWYGAVVIK